MAKKISPSKIETSTKADKKAAPKKVIVNDDVTPTKTVAKKQVVTKAVKQVAATKVTKKAIVKEKSKLVQITFQLKYRTVFGQNLFITGNHELLGNGDINKALPLQYFNEEFWYTTIELQMVDTNIIYNYVLKNADGSIVVDWGKDKVFNTSTIKNKLLLIDSWNDAAFIENTFYTEPFKNVLLKTDKQVVAEQTKIFTHTFTIKAPLLAANETVCLLGSASVLDKWNIDNPVLMNRVEGANYYQVNVNFTKEIFPIEYKYGVYNVATKTFVQYEAGSNRILYDAIAKNKQTTINDAFVALPNNTWKGAGIAIPVFSLRSANSFGVGEFNDIKLLVDWCKSVDLKLIQILPINDTTASNTDVDSYPYAAISAFALHPLYLNVDKMVNDKNKKLLAKLNKEKTKLNALDKLDYTATMQAKMSFVKKIYALQKKDVFVTGDYLNYFQQNKHWLVPYAAFCYLRDEYKTANYTQWPAYKEYNNEDIIALTNETSTAYDAIAIHYFIQYHLHLQLKEATEYAHANGVVLKGDIAIGVNRFGADTWQQPDLYNMDFQAGAPPDDFAIKGQNWGFPTYNWQQMMQDGFAWWKQRFEQMRFYFDAFRIDHILGFFRIWSIPTNAVEGIMGHFIPAIPVHLNEFHRKGIWVDYQRYTKPFINEAVLFELFGEDNEYVKTTFLNNDEAGNYYLKDEFATQRLVEKYFETLDVTEFNNKLKHGLYNLISNVILFEVEGSQAQQFHFRFAMDATTSFTYLDEHIKQPLKELYVDYFFKRQDNFWKEQAMQKLPALKRVTNMLICGEDLGLVPTCVPEVMQQLGLLSLEIQRMPKDASKQFSHPNDAPYLSVVTPSTHDMSTIRGWWLEDKNSIQQFYNQQLGQYGAAPESCEAWINKLIIIQHLYSPAMWSIFQLQDLLGIDENIRRANPADERINIPANPNNYWCYRMHLTLEALIKANDFNKELKGMIEQSGRYKLA